MRQIVYLAMLLALLPCAGCRNRNDTVKPGIALTYANDKQTDGAGAQLQRIYGIYAVAKYLHLPYVHSPLKELGYQGLTALEKNSISSHAQDRWNQVFRLPSDIELPDDAVSIYVLSPKLEDLDRLKAEAEKKHQFYLVRMLYPYDITEKNTEIYRPLKDVSPFKPEPSKVFRIAIHVRRGDEFVIESSRMLPNSYYIAATMKMVDALKQLDIPFVCELYTELPTKAFLVTPQQHGLQGQISKPVLVDPKMSHIEEFDVIPNLHKEINTDPIEALRGMATADALIISRSSFSYFAALFSRGIIIYFPFWHHPLKEWLTSDINGNLPSDQLVERLKEWKHDHS